METKRTDPNGPKERRKRYEINIMECKWNKSIPKKRILII